MNEIIIILILILLNGIFAMSEIAVISARKSSLNNEARKGNKAAQTAIKLANEPDRFLSTIQIGITLIGILTGIYSGKTLGVSLGDIFEDWGVSTRYSETLAQTIIVFAVTYLSIIFGELVPKRIGLSAATKMSLFVARPMNALSKIASPFVWLLAKSTSFIFNLLGIKSTGNKVTEEEIKSMIQEGREEGEVQPVEQDIVQRVFLMGDLKVSSIMTHKNDLVWMDLNMSSDEIRHTLESHIYNVYPIAEGNPDEIQGIIYLKDLILQINRPDFKIKDILHDVKFIHENMPVYKVLELMKKEKFTRAMVCDEFGTCQGIVTLKDILDGLVGYVEEGTENPDIIKRNEKEEWLVDGQCPFYDFLCFFKSEDLYKDVEYTTVAGLLLEKLQHIPSCGEQLQWHKFNFEVIDMDGARIDKLSVTINE